MGHSPGRNILPGLGSLLIGCLWLLALNSQPSPASASTASIPEQADGPLLIWNEKAKYYLVIAVDQTGVPGTELPFTLTDGNLVAKQFESLGYLPLLEKQLIGATATKNKVNAALKRIRTLQEYASVIIYYSGHGVASPNDKDVSLQLAGQNDLDYGLGIQVADLIESARDTTYLGELHLIIDACFSGTGAFTGALTLKEVGAKTTIFTSSATTQNSYPVTLNTGSKPSAFTHTILQALGQDWRKADDNGDGILRFGEIKTYSFNQLRNLHKQGQIPEQMRPQLVGGHHEEVILAYKREEVRRWESSTREALTLVALERSLIPTMPTGAPEKSEKPKIPQDAQILAKQLTPTNDDPYVLGIKAQAEGMLEDANAFFEKAEKLEEEHKEKLAKIYLARGRNMIYAGNYKNALSWYQKRVALKPTKDPAFLNEFGQAWHRAGKFREALPFYKEALDLREKTLKADAPDLAVSLNNLAVLYQTQGQYAEAEPLYQRAIQIDEIALGPNHPDLATDLNNLAELYRTQGQYAEAEPLYQRVIKIFEGFLGSSHPNVATALNNLAALYQTQGQYAEAEPLYQRAIQIDEIALGPKHPGLAADLNNLAELYRIQGQYAKAEPLYQRALAISEQALGADHPQVALNLNNLALLYDTHGQYAEAEPLYQRALTINGQALGADHPQVALNLNNLAELYRIQGQYAEAEPLYQRALAINGQALGADHPQVALNLNNLALLYDAQGKHAEAEPLYQRALTINGQALGADHPQVALNLNNLAELYRIQGQYAEAEPLYQRAYEILKVRLGLKHPNTKTVLTNYVEFLRKAKLNETITQLLPDLKAAFPGIYAQDSQGNTE
ncbi:tetratricopeptide repeat protein [Nitrospira sp. M1]